MLNRLFKKKTAEPTGISILLLQQRLERFSTERLNLAMQRGWGQEYDPEKFFALSIFDGDGAVIKAVGAFFGVQHFDRLLDSKDLGEQALPTWAIHTSYSKIEYKCPDGVPNGDERNRMYGFLGLLCAELLTPQTSALFFPEERILMQNNSELYAHLRSGKPFDPMVLAGIQS